MAYAVAHVIIPMVIIDLYRDYIAKKKFPTWLVLFGGIAGLVPDSDIPLGWLLSLIEGHPVNEHRLITHSVIFVVFFLLCAALCYMQRHKQVRLWGQEIPYEYGAIFFTIVAFGWFTHLMLDCFLAADGLLSWFPGVSLGFCTHSFSNDVLLGIDAIILILWLIHEQWSHKIKDYI